MGNVEKRLTRRQRAWADLVAGGMGKVEAAEAVGYRPKTVYSLSRKVHVQRAIVEGTIQGAFKDWQVSRQWLVSQLTRATAQPTRRSQLLAMQMLSRYLDREERKAAT